MFGHHKRAYFLPVLLLGTCIQAEGPSQSLKAAQSANRQIHPELSQVRTLSPSPLNSGGNSSSILCEVSVGCSGPVITQLVGATSSITPGVNVLATGTNFNAPNGTYGKFVLILTDASSGSTKEFPLVNPKDSSSAPEWSNIAVYGQVPSSVVGVLDQQGWLQIQRTDGLKSAPVPVAFTAQLSFEILEPSCLHLDQCSEGANQNQCNGWADFSPLIGFSAPSSRAGLTPSYFDVHVSFTGQYLGTDQYSFTLINGWQYVLFDWWANVDALGNGVCPGDHVGYPHFNQMGTQVGQFWSGGPFTFTLPWTSACQVDLWAYICVQGPAGTPKCPRAPLQLGGPHAPH